jgi:CTP:molybdopterin cytidylyltransferase MocA
LLEREIANVLHIQTDNDGIFADIDIPADLSKLRKILDKNQC